MRIDWLQVPDDMVRTRSATLARLLTEAVGRKVSQGDGLLLVCNLWTWVVSQVREDAEDLAAEFERCSTLHRSKAEMLLPAPLGWPGRHAAALLDALLDTHVGVLFADGDLVRVVEIRERYARLAKKQGDSRGRARANYYAKENGWKHTAGVGYVSPSGEVVEDWRVLLARFEDGTK